MRDHQIPETTRYPEEKINLDSYGISYTKLSARRILKPNLKE